MIEDLWKTDNPDVRRINDALMRESTWVCPACGGTQTLGCGCQTCTKCGHKDCGDA